MADHARRPKCALVFPIDRNDARRQELHHWDSPSGPIAGCDFTRRAVSVDVGSASLQRKSCTNRCCSGFGWARHKHSQLTTRKVAVDAGCSSGFATTRRCFRSRRNEAITCQRAAEEARKIAICRTVIVARKVMTRGTRRRREQRGGG